jgi:hypothetical protein
MTVKRDLSFVSPSDEALAVLEDLTAWTLMAVDHAAIRAAVGLAFSLSSYKSREGLPTTQRSD